MSSGKQSEVRINCMKCDHFYVTWDPRFPRGCHAYEFKSQHVPSAVVRSSSGTDCMKFTPKVLKTSSDR